MLSWIGLLCALSVATAVGGQPPPELPPVSAPIPPPPPNRGESKLRDVPFPLEGQTAAPNKKVKRHRVVRTSMADLRDPFVQPARARKYRKITTARLLLPDLKDPFHTRARVQPKNWKVPRVPGDIRDPFASSRRKRSLRKVPVGRCDQPRTTNDGIEIQRPSALKKKDAGKKPRTNCIQMVPKDLRDPFAAR